MKRKHANGCKVVQFLIDVHMESLAGVRKEVAAHPNEDRLQSRVDKIAWKLGNLVTIQSELCR